MIVKHSCLYLFITIAFALSPCYGATDGYSPKPDPITWRFVPAAMGPNTIYMKATPAIDVNNPPAKYYFKCTDHPEASSGWVSDANYTATGLTPGTTYSFKVRTCDDNGGDPNTQSRWSRTTPSATTDINTTPPVLKLDLNNSTNNDDANTQTGFVPLALESSGSEVNGVTVDLGGNITSARRDDPSGAMEMYDKFFGSIVPDPCWYNPRAGERIYRDFIYGTYPSGVAITLWGLGVNRDCNITIWAYDSQAGENRVANWYANGTYIFDTNFIGGATGWPRYDNQTGEGWQDLYKYAFSGTATADYLGRIILTSSKDPCSQANEPFAFVNAIKVEPNALTPFVPTEYAYHPVPVDGADRVSADVTLEWEKGGYAESHDVYLGTNFDDVNDANRGNPLGVLVSQNQSATTYTPAEFLDLNTTHYWRIDEVNGAPDYTIFKGEVWSFKTSLYFVMENFDSYANDAALRSVWKDGSTNGTSAEVSVETAIVSDGRSMKYQYKNDLPPYYSEVYVDTADLGMDDPDWLGIGFKTLVLYFYGEPNNPIGEQMYVKLTDGDSPANTATVTYGGVYGDMNNIRLQQWNKWGIPLTAFADVNLANVARITIGFGDGSPGSTGTVYFEDVGGSTTTLSVSPISLTLAAEANSTGTFTVTSNTSWTVSSSQYWLTVSPTSGSNNETVTVTAQANGSLTRRAKVTVYGDTSQTVTVTQSRIGGEGCTIPSMPPFSSLVSNGKFPDPFAFVDGPCMTKGEWECRRAEIAELVQEFELGYMQETPYSATTGSYSDGSPPSITVTVNDNGEQISFPCYIAYPSTGTAPYPAMIYYGYYPYFTLDSSAFSSMGVSIIYFPNDTIAQQVDASSRGIGEFYDMYGSDHSAGALMAWAWGVDRLIDALEKTPEANIDPTRLGMTGCSRNGKGALVAGAFCDRIKLTIPQESGAGGAASWRVSQYQRDVLGQNAQWLAEICGENVWFRSNFSQFGSAVNKLPFDHHMVAALCAPNALLFIENTSIDWLGNLSCWTNGKVTHMIWEAMGIPDRMGFSQVGGHAHCAFPSSQQPEVTAYVQKFLVGGGTADTNVMKTDGGFTFDEARWVDWTVPWVDLTVPNPIKGDLNHDCGVGFYDLALFVERWLDDDCLYNGWCYEADLNYDGGVNFSDYAELASHWLEGE